VVTISLRLERLGVEVIPLDVEPDHSFPRYNPNPEDMAMLHAIADKVRRRPRRSRSGEASTGRGPA
jgi:phosphomannomutase